MSEDTKEDLKYVFCNAWRLSGVLKKKPPRYCVFCKEKLSVTIPFDSMHDQWDCPEHGSQKESFVVYKDLA